MRPTVAAMATGELVDLVISELHQADLTAGSRARAA